VFLFLIRALETKVAVGGWLVQNGEHVKTSPIVNRLDIHKVVTEDGVEVSLEGTIDQETSTANGFPPGIVQCLSAGKFYSGLVVGILCSLCCVVYLTHSLTLHSGVVIS
jgi:hypothetical protein